MWSRLRHMMILSWTSHHPPRSHLGLQAQFRKQNEASYVEAYNLKAKYKEMTTKPMSSIKRRSLWPVTTKPSTQSLRPNPTEKPETKKPSSKPKTSSQSPSRLCGCSNVNPSDDAYSFELLTLNVSNCSKKIFTNKKWYEFRRLFGSALCAHTKPDPNSRLKFLTTQPLWDW